MLVCAQILHCEHICGRHVEVPWKVTREASASIFGVTVDENLGGVVATSDLSLTGLGCVECTHSPLSHVAWTRLVRR